MKYLNNVNNILKYEKYESVITELYMKFNGFAEYDPDTYTYAEKRELFNTYYNIFLEITDLDFFEHFANKLHWDTVIYAGVSAQNDKRASFYFLENKMFFEKFKDTLDWEYISQHAIGIFKPTKNTIDLFKQFEKYINWEILLQWNSHLVDINFLNAFPDKPYDWNTISRELRFSKKFGNQFKHKLNWSYVSKFHTLSEKTLREFQDYIDWKYIRFYKLDKFSKEFLIEFKDKLFKQY